MSFPLSTSLFQMHILSIIFITHLLMHTAPWKASYLLDTHPLSICYVCINFNNNKDKNIEQMSLCMLLTLRLYFSFTYSNYRKCILYFVSSFLDLVRYWHFKIQQFNFFLQVWFQNIPCKDIKSLLGTKFNEKHFHPYMTVSLYSFINTAEL